MFKSDLPAFSIAADVNRRLQEETCLVVTAPPGAGKSTILPLTILEGLAGIAGKTGNSGTPGKTRNSGTPGTPGSSGRIIMLEPRRIAARSVAERMAHLLGEAVGKTVGYRVRFESKVSSATRIEVVTEGILTRMLIDDPTLDGVDVVIFDEFHERSLHTDEALALTREMQQVLRPELRIVIMSATIDATTICHALADSTGRPAPLVESEGRMFPVEIRYATESATADNCAALAAEAVRQATADYEGDVLVFLPGEGEIRRCADCLGQSLGSISVLPLYGNLSMAEQRRAIAPSPEGERKVVLATNIAETSLTIEGVRVVIDSGLCRTMVHDASTGLSHLESVRISMDMATQRSGRAGRVAPGICYRLWTRATELRMAEHRTPEILTTDLAPLVLDVATWGTNDLQQLPWMTPPPRPAVAQAVHLLTSLRALEDGKITPQGKRLAQMPCHPRIAQMLVSATSSAEKALAADLAALLEERDILTATESSADLCLRIDALRRSRSRWPRVQRAAEQYRRLVRASEDNTSCLPSSVGKFIAAAYPERIAKAHPDGCGRFLLATGDTARVEASDLLAAYEWLAVASYDAASGRIFLAAPVEPHNLSSIIYIKDNLSWDTKRGALIARRERRIGGLIVDSRPLSNVPRDAVQRIICDAVRHRGESILDFSNEAVVTLQQRVATVAAWHPDLALPDLSLEAVIERVEEWLPLYMENATTTAELKRIDLVAALSSLLTYEQQQALDRLAPTHITVPTGSRIRLEYRPAAQQPVLRVRLQECFGMQDTPRLDDGRQPVLMELLSPGFKPVQLTQDLHSFWTTTYFEVRKELRRRYPKHHWPDDPLAADPVRGVKRK